MWLTAIVAVFTTQIISCKKEEPAPEAISGFSYAVDETNYKQVTFTNASQNYTSLEWDFGDGDTSTDENPVHTYAEVGVYTVTLKAISSSSNDESSQEITVADPNEMLTALAGDDSKTWKLLRDVSTGRYPLEVGPWDRASIWWAVGRDNDEIAGRPCMFNDEWTFSRDGAMVFDAMGDYWGEGGIVAEDLENDCQSTNDMVGPDDEDLSAWGGGEFTYVLTPGSDPKLKVDGLGAFVGFFKLGNLEEVSVPQTSVTYDIVKLSDGDVDTLIVEGQYKWDDTDGGYWRFVLVHYDNPDDEPDLPTGTAPTAGFTATISGSTLTTANASTDGDTYEWDFGDGTTSTEENPVHDYAEDGVYAVTLTVSNAFGSSSAGPMVYVASGSSPDLTDAILQNGSWTIRIEDYSVFVGPGFGDASWWSVPEDGLNGTSTGGDDWSCLADDEFTFSTGGVYGYDTKGTVRNDGYFEGLSGNGCYSDAELAGVTNDGKMYRTFANHSYLFTPASGGDNATITVTDGAADAKAFIGFYKPYNGGENSDQANAAGGGTTSITYEVLGYADDSTQEYLLVSVDYTADQNGSQAWSIVLVR